MHDIPTHLSLLFLQFGTCHTWLCCKLHITVAALSNWRCCRLAPTVVQYSKIAMQNCSSSMHGQFAKNGASQGKVVLLGNAPYTVVLMTSAIQLLV